MSQNNQLVEEKTFDTYIIIILKSDNEQSLKQIFNKLNVAYFKNKYESILLTDFCHTFNITVPNDTFGNIEYISNGISFNEQTKQYYFHIETSSRHNIMKHIIKELIKHNTDIEDIYFSTELDTNVYINTDTEKQYFQYNALIIVEYNDLSYSKYCYELEDCYKDFYNKAKWEYTDLNTAKNKIEQLKNVFKQNNKNFSITIFEYENE